MNVLPRTKHAWYLESIFKDPDAVIGYVEHRLKDWDYDTIVGCGVSGTLLLLQLRKRLSKNIAVVRKNDDGSHSRLRVEGTIGERYVVVDDQVATGKTIVHIRSVIKKQLDLEIRTQAKFVGFCSFLPPDTLFKFCLQESFTASQFDDVLLEVFRP